MDPISQFFSLLLFGLVVCWPLTLPAGGLLLWSLAQTVIPAREVSRWAVGRCYLLLAIGPAAVFVSVAIGHQGPPLQWPGWVDWLLPFTAGLHALAGTLLVVRARGARPSAFLAVLGSWLLTVAFTASGTMALTGVGP